MKRISIILMSLVMLAIGTQSCIAQAKIFKEAADIDGVTSVYVSPLMLKLGASVSDLGKDGLDEAVEDLRAVEIISCENPKNLRRVQEICRPIVKKIGGEVLVEVSDEGDKTTIYAVLDNGGIYAKEVVVEVSESDEYTVIYIAGKINLKKLAENYDK